MVRMPCAAIGLLAALSVLTSPTAAQPVRGGPGYELALHGRTEAYLGGTHRLSGTAYEVHDLADLRPLARGEIVARLTRLDDTRRRRISVREQTVSTDARGNFTLAIEIPEQALPSPQLELTVRRPQSAGREFTYSLSLESPLQIDLLTDRNLYEPGEPIRVWSRVSRRPGEAPVAQRRVRLTVTDPQGRQLESREVTSSAAGVATLEVELPESAVDGHYAVGAELVQSVATASAGRSVRVGRRTVERLLIETELDQSLVPPSGTLSGHVAVRTPSGTPVLGATVELRTAPDHEPTTLTTDAEGIARFRIQAPAFLSGDVSSQAVIVRVTHPAHGTLHSSKGYLLSRTQFLVTATAENGALVPEVDAYAFVSVTDPRGEPVDDGLEIEVRGPAVRGGAARATTDAHGLARIPMRVPEGASAPAAGDSQCAGRDATSFTVSIAGERPYQARTCVYVAPEAQVLIRAAEAIVAPGAEVAIEIARRPDVRGRPVLVEALLADRAIAATWIDGSRDRGSLELPGDVNGVLAIRARPVLAHDARHPVDEPGGASVGTGTLTAVLVRPPDAFALEISAEQDVYRVRERARLGLEATPPPPAAYAALVARDLAAHGGEQPWELRWLRGALDAAVTDPGTEHADLLVRSALAAGLGADPEAVRPPPLVPDPWEPRRGWSAHSSVARGQLRDPVAMRDELLRRGVGRMMVQIERVVSGLGADPRQREGVVVRRGSRTDFAPNAIDTLIERRQLADGSMRTLGDRRATVAMLEGADPGFDFDNVARRVTRQRLVRLAVALAAFANPDDENAARASAGEPPERWLSRMVQLGLVPSDALVDPWGNAFVFRRASGTPRIVLSERAPGWELVSPGPDGRVGTGDDVADPFVRVLPTETPYAVASGEDELMKRLSVLAPGPQVLQAMLGAYDSVALAAQEEMRRSVVDSSVSENAQVLDALASADIGSGGLALEGRAAGDFAQPMQPPAATRARPAASPEPMPMEDAEAEAMDEDDRGYRAREQNRNERAHAPPPPPPPPQGGRLAVLGEMIRERFPATLFFLGEVPLDGPSTLVELPLADALTTYRVEAIAWTGSGWTTAASGEVRVDREAVVDAPIPPFATAGDTLRIPVRIQNRTAQVLRARVELSLEELSAAVPEPRAVDVPPNDSVETVVEVTVGAVGEGAAVVRAVRASDGSPLDAVRRPLVVYADARLVRESRELLIRSTTSVALVVPEDATERGPGELRVAPGVRMFGGPEDWAGYPLWASWALALAGLEIPEDIREAPRAALLTSDAAREEIHGDPVRIALAVGGAWKDDVVSDAVMRRALRAVSRVLEARGERDEVDAGTAVAYSNLLLALSPAVRAGGRARARADLDELAAALRDGAAAGSAGASDSPVLWAAAASALSLASSARDRGRVEELLRRAERHVVRAGDEAFLEEPVSAGTMPSRVGPSALMALSLIGLGELERAMPFLRSLSRIARYAEHLPGPLRALAASATGLISSGARSASLRVDVDGRRIEGEIVDGLFVAELPGLGRPGAHRVEVTVGEDAVALAWIDLRYGRPWDAAPERPAAIGLEVDGELGARDTRSGLLLRVDNRGARILSRPVVELDLPAGAELDEPTRELLEALGAGRPTTEDRTLRIPLRPLAPGGHVELPMPVRWSVGGSIRGLGVSAYDDAEPPGLSVRRTAVLASRPLSLADEGAEPEQAEADASDPPRPPPPPPDPIPLLERLGPVAGVSR